MASSRGTLTLLDACSVVSLYATRHMAEILRVCPSPGAVVVLVAQEAQYVLRGGEGEDAHEREPILLHPLITAGALTVISTDDEEELATFIDLTQQLDDGEAMTAALAIHRSHVVVTDDRKAIRLLHEQGVTVHSTLGLLKDWVDQQHVNLVVQRAILRDLRTRGRYEPPRSHPYRGWWEQVMAQPINDISDE